MLHSKRNQTIIRKVEKWKPRTEDVFGKVSSPTPVPPSPLSKNLISYHGAYGQFGSGTLAYREEFVSTKNESIL